MKVFRENKVKVGIDVIILYSQKNKNYFLKKKNNCPSY